MKLKEFLKEGGNATSEFGTIRIDKKDIPPTITHLSSITGIPRNDFVLIGSTGKTPSSGDIDVAISSLKHDKNEIHDKLMSALNGEGVEGKGIQVSSYAVPIAGKENKGKVQVDIMFVENPSVAQFTYFSPGEGSKYKGVIRVLLLRSIAATINEKGRDHFEFNDDGDLTIRAGRTLDMNKGLRRIFQHRPLKKRGSGYLKNMKTLSMEEFKEIYPHVEVKGNDIIIDDPDKITKLLFGQNVSPKDIETPEQILHLIQTKFSEEKREEIINKAKKRAKTLKNVRLPEILKYDTTERKSDE